MNELFRLPIFNYIHFFTPWIYTVRKFIDLDYSPRSLQQGYTLSCISCLLSNWYWLIHLSALFNFKFMQDHLGVEGPTSWHTPCEVECSPHLHLFQTVMMRPLGFSNPYVSPPFFDWSISCIHSRPMRLDQRSNPYVLSCFVRWLLS